MLVVGGLESLVGAESGLGGGPDDGAGNGVRQTAVFWDGECGIRMCMWSVGLWAVGKKVDT